MPYINYRENNPLYSPGLSTYTSEAEKGDKGRSGLSMYYNDGIIMDNKSEEERVIQNIISGSILSSSDASGDHISYKTGDIIVDGNADVYQIDMGDLDEMLKYIGTIRQSVGKIYIKKVTEENTTYEIAPQFNEIGSITDQIKLVMLDDNYNITSSNPSYIKIINTTTGEVAIFNNIEHEEN